MQTSLAPRFLATRALLSASGCTRIPGVPALIALEFHVYVIVNDIPPKVKLFRPRNLAPVLEDGFPGLEISGRVELMAVVDILRSGLLGDLRESRRYFERTIYRRLDPVRRSRLRSRSSRHHGVERSFERARYFGFADRRRIAHEAVFVLGVEVPLQDRCVLCLDRLVQARLEQLLDGRRLRFGDLAARSVARPFGLEYLTLFVGSLVFPFRARQLRLALLDIRCAFLLLSLGFGRFN